MRWTGPEEGEIEVDDEFDEPPPDAAADEQRPTAPKESTDE